MQQSLKKFTVLALIALATLLTGVAATREVRSHTHVTNGSHRMLDVPAFFPGSFVRSAGNAVTAPVASTPVPVNSAAPAVHAATTFTVEVRGNNTFSPASITIAPGDTVVWVRTGGSHNVVADDGSFRLGQGAAGNVGGSWTTVSHTFTVAGTFRYYCEAHGGSGGIGMSGTVIVQSAATTPTPTATVAGPSPTATATATLIPTTTGTVVAPSPSKIYIPIAASS